VSAIRTLLSNGLERPVIGLSAAVSETGLSLDAETDSLPGDHLDDGREPRHGPPLPPGTKCTRKRSGWNTSSPSVLKTALSRFPAIPKSPRTGTLSPRNTRPASTARKCLSPNGGSRNRRLSAAFPIAAPAVLRGLEQLGLRPGTVLTIERRNSASSLSVSLDLADCISVIARAA
jgi:hypothetical protein